MKRFVMLSIILSALLVSCIPGKSASQSRVGVSVAGSAGMGEVTAIAGTAGIAGRGTELSNAGVAGK